MKKLLLLISLFLGLTLQSCKKENCTPDETPEEEIIDWSLYGASAWINGELWTFNFCSYSVEDDGQITLSLRKRIWYANSGWVNRENILIVNMPLKSDTLNLKNNPISSTVAPITKFYTSVSDGDVGAECYDIEVINNFKSSVVLTEINEEKGFVKGVGQMFFLVSDFCPKRDPLPLSDTLRVENLQFKAVKR